MIKKNKNTNIGLIVASVFLYISIIVVTGITQIFILNADWTIIKSVDFWIEQAVKSITYFGAYVATATIVYISLGDKEPKYNEIEDSIHKNRDKLIGKEFRAYINDLDFSNKREAWLAKYQVKLTNLNKKITRKITTEVSNLPEEEWSWKTRRYMKKERRYQEYLTDKWINENLKFAKIKYPEITVSEVINGTLKMKTSRSMLNRGHLSKQIYQKIGFVLASIFAGALWATIEFTRNDDWRNIVAQLAFTLVMLLVNTLMGSLAGGRGHLSRLVTANERYEIILDYVGKK